MIKLRISTASGFALSGALILFNGCALKKPPDRPAILKESVPGVLVPEKWKAPAGADAKIADNWLARFEDPKLQALVEEGLRNSPDLGAAAARMEAAAGAVKLAGAKLYPEIAARGALTEQSKGRLFEGIATGAAAGVLWELDLWGRVRAGKAAASETYRAQAADFEFARQSLAAAVARSWFLASQAYEQRELARAGAANFEQLLALTKVRREQGFATDEDVALASVDQAGARDFLTSAELVFQDSVRVLEILIGRYPSTELQTRPELPPVPSPVPAGVPSELLERRPDVVSAERRVAAAFYLTAEAKAARLPRISIGGAIGTASADLVGNRDVSNPIWSVGGAIDSAHIPRRRLECPGQDPDRRAARRSQQLRQRGSARVQRSRGRTGGGNCLPRSGTGGGRPGQVRRRVRAAEWDSLQNRTDRSACSAATTKRITGIEAPLCGYPWAQADPAHQAASRPRR